MPEQMELKRSQHSILSVTEFVSTAVLIGAISVGAGVAFAIISALCQKRLTVRARALAGSAKPFLEWIFVSATIDAALTMSAILAVIVFSRIKFGNPGAAVADLTSIALLVVRPRGGSFCYEFGDYRS